ncbi:MAG: hypothetical protein AABW73_01235 [Nanoarchaeota archaeon]|mgnify:CR=1 FL=1
MTDVLDLPLTALQGDRTSAEVSSYLEVCGADDRTLREMKFLADSISVDSDPKVAALDIKRDLRRSGFVYVPETFRPQDVLSRKGGNCVGLPFLIASIMYLKGYSAGFRCQTGVKDACSDVEVEGEMGHFELATSQKKSPLGKYASLEHMILDVDRFPIECTAADWEPSKCEREVRISYSQGLSCVIQSIASDATHDGHLGKARELTDKGLTLWPDNRSLHLLSSFIAEASFDDDSYIKSIEAFKRIGGGDSSFHHTMFHLTGVQSHLGDALYHYPALARAVADQAELLVKSDPLKAECLFVSASHMFSDSSAMKLAAFYIDHAQPLAKVFGRRKIFKILSSFSKSDVSDGEFYWSDFHYHSAMFKLSGKHKHLSEMRESCDTPYQRLAFVELSKGTPLHDPREERFLDGEFGNSVLYQRAKKSFEKSSRGYS